MKFSFSTLLNKLRKNGQFRAKTVKPSQHVSTKKGAIPTKHPKIDFLQVGTIGLSVLRFYHQFTVNLPSIYRLKISFFDTTC
jgi:hypothetical protein